MAKEYAELTGKLPPGAVYRPERHRIRQLLTSEQPARLCLGEEELAVLDLSMNGLSVRCGRPLELEPGQAVQGELRIGERVAFRGRLRLARGDARRTGAVLGFAVEDGFIDLPALKRQDEAERLSRALSQGPDPGRGAVPEEYRQALLRVLAFVQFQRHVLGAAERSIRAEGGRGVDERLRQLEQQALAALRPAWTELRWGACRASLPLLGAPPALRAAKALTEALLTPLLLDAPCVARSYLKPLGYPGDYQVMVHCYEDALEGETTFGRVFHKLWIEHPMPSGVRTRRDLVVDHLLQQMDRAEAQGRPLRLTLLGCGPAREIPALVARRSGWTQRLQLLLIDQEEEALSLAWRTARPLLVGEERPADLTCLTLSFTQLLLDPELLPRGPGQDLIGCSGLFDYLRPPVARALLQAMYARLAPGGRLVVGNALREGAEFWSPELVLDWSMIYRDDAEMLELGAALPPSARLSIQHEPGGAYTFLIAERGEDP